MKTILKGDIIMKTYTVIAKLMTNGATVTSKVQAESADQAELIAGRKFLEYGFSGNDIKIMKVD